MSARKSGRGTAGGPDAIAHSPGAGAVTGAGAGDVAVNSTPFATLTPDAVLDAAERSGWTPDGRLFALNSYENRVYRVGRIDAEPIGAEVLSRRALVGSQILEEHAFPPNWRPRRCRWRRRW